jgi:NAD(P)-dependent dehydrogenase (short-subunit alcohol dehydrogenase family)
MLRPTATGMGMDTRRAGMARNARKSRRGGDATTRKYRKVQQQVDRVETRQTKGRRTKASRRRAPRAPDTGRPREPVPPFPAQHLPKPGLESELDPRPRYRALGYKGSDKLLGQVALITGGDSGIGRAVAVLFAREGANVAIMYLPDEQSDAEETRRAVEEEGRRCLLLPGDVSDFDLCRDAVETTVRELGRLDVLVNNAAFQEHAGSLEELTLEHFDRTIKTNLYGYFHMAKAALPHLRDGGAIINSGSVTGIFGNKDLLDYSMTKGGIHAFTRSLSENLIERGIRVNAVAPGPVWTPLNPADKDAEGTSQFGADTPIKRPAQPEELAPTYVFLAAAACSSYITGEVIPVIGGYTSR